ncbi:MAG TPA: hypothetical protein PLL48_16875 [Novosphingobium sp.]|jgi:hypothetical protein|nr:hypothetical protein [Novosphingobium sp.]
MKLELGHRIRPVPWPIHSKPMRIAKMAIILSSQRRTCMKYLPRAAA